MCPCFLREPVCYPCPREGGAASYVKSPTSPIALTMVWVAPEMTDEVTSGFRPPSPPLLPLARSKIFAFASAWSAHFLPPTSGCCRREVRVESYLQQLLQSRSVLRSPAASDGSMITPSIQADRELTGKLPVPPPSLDHTTGVIPLADVIQVQSAPPAPPQ